MTEECNSDVNITKKLYFFQDENPSLFILWSFLIFFLTTNRFFIDTESQPTRPFSYSIPSLYRTIATPEVTSVLNGKIYFDPGKSIEKELFHVVGCFQIITSPTKCAQATFFYSPTQPRIAVGSKYGTISVK